MYAPAVGSHIVVFSDEETRKLQIFNSATGKSYQIGEKESQVLRLLDGRHTLSEIRENCRFYSESDIEQLMKAFDDIGLFEKTEQKRNVLKIKKKLLNPNDIMAQDGIVTRGLFSLIMVGCPALLAVGIAANISGSTTNRAADILSEYMQFGAGEMLLLLALTLLCLSLHEIGHVVAARFYGVNVPEIGVMLYCFLPCAYTNISGINLLENHGQRLIVLAAGNITNLGLAGICYLGMSFADAHTAALLLAVILVNALTVFMNAMVFLKFDGYYMLEVLLDEPGLKENAARHTRQYVQMIIRRDWVALKNYRNNQMQQPDGQVRHLMYLTYTFMSFACLPLIVGSSVLSVIMMT